MEDRQGDRELQQPPNPEPSQTQSALVQARQRRKIAELEGKLEVLESGRAVKERYDGRCMHRVSRCFAHYPTGKQIIIWLKEEALDALLLCSTALKTSSPKMTEDMMTMTRMRLVLSSKFFNFLICHCDSECTYRFVCSQDRLETGYAILTRTLPWYVKETSEMEYDDYTRMIKTVCFTYVDDWLYHFDLCLA
jgi:hypothetical protein